MNTVAIGSAHWVYAFGVGAIVVTMLLRANVVVPAVMATALVVFAATGSAISAVSGVFMASFIAAKELFNIFLVIALMTALLNALKILKSDIRMVEPFRAVMKNGHSAFVILAFVTYLISLFFWPTPAVPLVAAVLLPAAIAAGLPPLVSAAVIAIAGQGMALSSDYIIGVAPGISAKAAGSGVSAALVGDRALVLSFVVGGIALLLLYAKQRQVFLKPSSTLLQAWQAVAESSVDQPPEKKGTFDKAEMARAVSYEQPFATDADIKNILKIRDQRLVFWSKSFAVLTPFCFLIVIAVMILPKYVKGMPDLKGGDAASLIGGAAALLMIFATWAASGSRHFFEDSANHITDGFVFAFKAMGSVLPIAGLFFVGAGDTAGPILGLASSVKAPHLLFELIQSAQHLIPQNDMLVSLGILLVGMITGIDGSGFAGLPLTGSLSGALAPVAHMNPATLAAVGQMGAVWTGGGTLVAWSSLIAVAGFARVHVMELVRVLVVPVITGLVVAALVAPLIWTQ